METIRVLDRWLALLLQCLANDVKRAIPVSGAPNALPLGTINTLLSLNAVELGSGRLYVRIQLTYGSPPLGRHDPGCQGYCLISRCNKAPRCSKCGERVGRGRHDLPFYKDCPPRKHIVRTAMAPSQLGMITAGLPLVGKTPTLCVLPVKSWMLSDGTAIDATGTCINRPEMRRRPWNYPRTPC